MDKIKEEFEICFDVYRNLGAQEMKDTLSSAVSFNSTYSGLLLVIMTHGLADGGNMLYGLDGELVSLKELVALLLSK